MGFVPVKIITLLSQVKGVHFSIEVSPGFDVNLLSELKEKPLFCAVTWHAKTHKCRDLEIPSIQLAENISKLGINVLLHVSCDYLRRNYFDDLLEKLKKINVINIFVVQGDNFDAGTSDFPFAKDVVLYIKKKTDNFFCIGVAAYPNSNETEIQYLKTKIECGADFIITQACFDDTSYLDLVNNCRSIQINVPIIPGIFLFQSVKQLKGFTQLCNVKISENLCNYLENKNVENVGVDVIRKVVEELRQKGNNIIHFFSNNNLQFVMEFLTIMNKKLT